MNFLSKIFLIKIFTHIIEGLSTDGTIKLDNLPEYSELVKYYRGENITGDPLLPSKEKIVAPVPKFLNLPFENLPLLCKENPKDNSFYGHVFCWGMIGLYALLIASLIIYQLRSVLWFKFNFNSNNHVRKSDYTNSQGKPEDITNISRMFSV